MRHSRNGYDWHYHEKGDGYNTEMKRRKMLQCLFHRINGALLECMQNKYSSCVVECDIPCNMYITFTDKGNEINVKCWFDCYRTFNYNATFSKTKTPYFLTLDLANNIIDFAFAYFMCLHE